MIGERWARAAPQRPAIAIAGLVAVVALGLWTNSPPNGSGQKDPRGNWVDGLANPDSEGRLEALRALTVRASHSPDAARLLVSVLADSNRDEFHGTLEEMLAHIRPELRAAAPQILALLGTDRADVRAQAAAVLGNVGRADAASSGALQRALADRDSTVRVAAAKALGSLGPIATGAGDALAVAAGDSSAMVRLAATRALVALPRDTIRSLPTLIERLDDPSEPVRLTAAYGVAQYGMSAHDAVPALRRGLSHPHFGLRRTFAHRPPSPLRRAGAIHPADAGRSALRASITQRHPDMNSERDDGLHVLELPLRGLAGEGAKEIVTPALMRIPGVIAVVVQSSTFRVHVIFDPSCVAPSTIGSALHALGVGQPHAHGREHSENEQGECPGGMEAEARTSAASGTAIS